MYIDFVSSKDTADLMNSAFPNHSIIVCPYNLRRYPDSKNLTLEEVFKLNGEDILYSLFNEPNTIITILIDYSDTNSNLFTGLVLSGLRDINYKGYIKVMYATCVDSTGLRRAWYPSSNMTLTYVLNVHYLRYLLWYTKYVDQCGSKDVFINVTGIECKLVPTSDYFDVVTKRFCSRTNNSVSGIIHHLVNNPPVGKLSEDEAGEIINMMLDSGLLKIEAEAFDVSGKFDRDDIVRVKLKPEYYEAVCRLDLLKRYFAVYRDRANRYVLRKIIDRTEVMELVYYPTQYKLYYRDERIAVPNAISLATHKDIMEVLDEINDVLGIDYLDYILEAELSDGRLISGK
ncbi:MAG: hypothetical protein MJ238_05465 [Bacilli bacterium]|nr:hypothetical protein [Bacilli bacterium]